MNAKGDVMEFAETVANNRGIPIRRFVSVAEAEQWLLERGRGGAAPSGEAESKRR